MPGVWRLHRYHGRRNRCCFLHRKSNHSRIRCYCRIHSHSHSHCCSRIRCYCRRKSSHCCCRIHNHCCYSHSHIHNYNDSIHIYKV